MYGISDADTNKRYKVILKILEFLFNKVHEEVISRLVIIILYYIYWLINTSTPNVIIMSILQYVSSSLP